MFDRLTTQELEMLGDKLFSGFIAAGSLYVYQDTYNASTRSIAERQQGLDTFGDIRRTVDDITGTLFLRSR